MKRLQPISEKQLTLVVGIIVALVTIAIVSAHASSSNSGSQSTSSIFFHSGLDTLSWIVHAPGQYVMGWIDQIL